LSQSEAIRTPGLSEVSRAVLLEGQAASGAYIACPNFSQYGFGWLRDGAYCALALQSIGETTSVTAFHAWVAGVITARADRVDEVVAALAAGRTPDPATLLPTRYRLDGTEEREGENEWPNFQLDGYGTWLFALYCTYGPALPAELAAAARLAARYIGATWRLPCYDYWEEYGARLHTSTLGAIAAGLRGAARMLGDDGCEETAAEIVAFIRSRCVSDGVFVKGPDDDRVDGSLVSLATPFALFGAEDPVMRATVERIRTDLASPSGGIRRYLGDNYYGGSPWVLLTAWLGWHDRLTGNETGYRHALDWVGTAVSSMGTLPEQVVTEPQLPEFVAQWESLWGPVADPLLWSHAKHLLLLNGKAATWN
jgi:GH15 family glucan-1,4-alpha-glucosidase